MTRHTAAPCALPLPFTTQDANSPLTNGTTAAPLIPRSQYDGPPLTGTVLPFALKDRRSLVALLARLSDSARSAYDQQVAP